MKQEPLYLLMQPEPSGSYWKEKIKDGLYATARRARIPLSIMNMSDNKDIVGCHIPVIGNNSLWVESAISLLLEKGAEPIIVNASIFPPTSQRFSSVVFELEEMIAHCIKLLNASGRCRTALLATSKDSVTDKAKASVFSNPDDIFWADGTLYESVVSFADKLKILNYDSVICANDTVAICLVQELLQRGYNLPDDLYIIGMGNSFIGQGLSLPLTSIMFDYEKMGDMTIQLYQQLNSSVVPCRMTLSLPCQLIVRKSAPFAKEYKVPSASQNLITPQRAYFDGEMVQNIIKIESVLQQTDAINREILFGLARGETCEDIAARLFFSPRAIRYRLAHIVNHYNFSGRNSLRQALLNAFFTE